MLARRLYPLIVFALLCGLVPLPCSATDYDESASMDFSGDGLTPTIVGTLTAGSNRILGATGRIDSVDRDYFTVTVPSGYGLVSLTELPGTTVGGNFSFIGLQAGNQVTLPTNTTTANGLLGWKHYNASDANTDLLPGMSVPANGSSGFAVPLAAGDYAFWIQDSSPGTFNYGFDLVVNAVPEPTTCATLFVGCAVVLGGLRRRVRKSRRSQIS